MGPRCSFCGTADGPFLEVEGVFTLLMCVGCQAARGSSSRAGLPTPRAKTHGPHQPTELVVQRDPSEPWLGWGCPIEGCGYRVVLPWWLVGHTAAEHSGWTATWEAEWMRVVDRRVESPEAS